jgi:RNA polymerase sigma-70 factor (ECF subfamily)
MKDSDHISNRDAPPPNSTSTSLIEQVKQGDRGKCEQLMRVYRPVVLWWCRSKVPRHEDREDLVQEVFSTVFQKIGEFTKQPHRGAFRAWLKQITQYKLLEHHKQAGHCPPPAGGTAAQERLAAVPDIHQDESSAAEQVSERRILLRSAMAEIRACVEPNTWEAAWRTVVEDQPAADVARVLGMTTAAVYIAKSRILKRLRQELDNLLD